jgi:2'-5' RNA ligase
VAVAIPDAIREALRDVQVSLRNRVGGARWVRPEGIHLTLRFLGEIDETMLDAVGKGLTETVGRCGPPFSLVVGGIGYFPPRGRPRVVWIGLSNPAGDPAALSRLCELQSAIEGTVRAAGLSPETRPFHPHLTLARLDERGPRQPPAIPGDAHIGRGSLPVESVRLYRSTLSRSGASYDVLREYAL